mmetsp:Transcript_5133/g.12022  ORF Transcript_5133/g.12022 Transcript_5133/m.12022 type:complete len:264 (+) Transcript_5133:1913-2704(+)
MFGVSLVVPCPKKSLNLPWPINALRPGCTGLSSFTKGARSGTCAKAPGVGRKTSISPDLPLTVIGARRWNSRRPPHSSRHARSTSTPPVGRPASSTPWDAARCISRAARFTVSPRTVYSRRAVDPTAPQNTSPHVIPTDAAKPMAKSRAQTARAASVARGASSTRAPGLLRPKQASKVDPLSSIRNLFTPPRYANTSSWTQTRASCTRCKASCCQPTAQEFSVLDAFPFFELVLHVEFKSDRLSLKVTGRRSCPFAASLSVLS